MKQSITIVLVAALILSVASVALGADVRRGTIKGVDAAQGTIVFCPEGTEDKITMQVGSTVSLDKVKPDMKVQLFMDGDVVKGLKILKRRMIIGC